ncbi:MAG: hypothetical protein DMG26_01410 [Acidobacteria bacterium]|nr:MAG: hypothetical protein DMG26_01410 [Acidobacteriota bacterium]
MSSVTRLSQARPGARASCLLLLGASGCGRTSLISPEGPNHRRCARRLGCIVPRAELEETQDAHSRVTRDESVVVRGGAEDLGEEG